MKQPKFLSRGNIPVWVEPLPRKLEQTVPGEEAGHTVPGQVVDPALPPQLGHDGVNIGEACPALGPGLQLGGVMVPRNLGERNLVIARAPKENSPKKTGWAVLTLYCT